MKIEILKIYRQSFEHTWKHMLEWFRVAYAPFVVWIIGALFLGVSYWSAGCSYNPYDFMMEHSKNLGKVLTCEAGPLASLGNFIYFITNIIALTNLYIKGFRYAILQEGGKRWFLLHFDWIFVKMILYYILIMLLMTAYILVSGGIVGIAHYLLASVIFDILLGAVLVIYGFYLLFRISLYTILVSLDKKDPIKTSWRLLKRHVARAVTVMVLVSLSVAIITGVGMGVLALLGGVFSLISPALMNLIWIVMYAFGIFMWFIMWAVGIKAWSLIYQTVSKSKAR